MTLGALSTTFVLAVLLHNSEEAWLLPAWSRHAGRLYRPVGRAEFRLAVALFSALMVAVAALAFRQGPRSLGAYLFFGFVFAMAANAVVPHLALTLALRRYMPGTATGLLLNLPLGASLLQDAFRQHWIAFGRFLWVAPAVGMALVATIPLLLAAARLLLGSAAQEAEDRSSAER